MALDEIIISRAILERFARKFSDGLDLDVAIVGAGPSGLVAGYYLAKAQKKVALFERKMSIGGGMWGGGMLFNEIVIQKEAKHVMDEFDIRIEEFQEGYYTADAVETVSCLCAAACRAGLTVFNGITVEDLLVREGRVAGLVINWSAVVMAGLHVDPLAVRARCVIDATGHPAEIVQVLQRKNDITLRTPSGRFQGERSLWAEMAEQSCGAYRRSLSRDLSLRHGGERHHGRVPHGPVFGGMLLSGKKAADLVLAQL